jgi:hypothetical protein
MLDVHWKSLMPELTEARDQSSLELQRRYRAAEARAEKRLLDSGKEARVVSLSWARNERRFRKAR